MRRKIEILLCALSVLILFTGIFGQEIPTDRLTVPLSDPSRPGLIKAGLLNGGITVKGYEGKEVIVEARVRADGDWNAEKDEENIGIRKPCVSGRLSSVPALKIHSLLPSFAFPLRLCVFAVRRFVWFHS